MDIFVTQMHSEDPRPKEMESPGSVLSESRMNPGRNSGVFNVYRMSASAILVNLNASSAFDYRVLYRMSSLAIRTGGLLEACNEDIAIFAFPQGGITTFMEEIGFVIKITKTMVSPKDKGISKVNIRFLGR